MATSSSLTPVDVKAGDGAAAAAVDKLVATGRPLLKFIIVVNNKTGFELKRTNSAGRYDSFPLSTIGKDLCLASFYDHEDSMRFGVQYTAPDCKPGVHTVALSGSWPAFGYRKIGVFGGKNADHAQQNLSAVSDCTDAFGNKATICQVNGRRYVYEYELMKLGYEQYAVDTQDGDEAIQNALDLFATNRKLPGFVFIVNNHTEYDLYLEEEKIEDMGSHWPLKNVGKKQCAIGGLQHYFMGLAVQYTARDANPYQKSIGLAGSWPIVLPRKISISPGRGARYAWDNMHATGLCNERGNQARIEEREGSAIYVYDITNFD